MAATDRSDRRTLEEQIASTEEGLSTIRERLKDAEEGMSGAVSRAAELKQELESFSRGLLNATRLRIPTLESGSTATAAYT